MKYEKVPSFLIHVRFDPLMSDIEMFRTDTGLGIIKSVDDTPKWGKLKHVSVSRADRYPGWDELLEVKEHFFGDVDCAMLMPKKEDYVNVHQNCFHIWQVPQEWGIR